MDIRKYLNKKNILSIDDNSLNSNTTNINTSFDEPQSKRTKVRSKKYKEEYIRFGFSWTGTTDFPLPLCVVCGHTKKNGSMVPSKLSRHLEKVHPNLLSKDESFFRRLIINNEKEIENFENIIKVSDKAQIASYEVAQLIAQKGKSHSIAETLVGPACRIMVKSMLGDDAEKEIDKIPLSNDTIGRRIRDMSENILDKVQNKVDGQVFALQIDESTDISGKAQLMGFVRFINGDLIMNQFLFCQELTRGTTGREIFTCVDNFFFNRRLSWDLCTGICTDGAPSMTGSEKGFIAFAKRNNPNIIFTHCIIHREVLVSKTLPADLNSVLEDVIKIVNYIKSSPLKSRIFKDLCSNMESNYNCLLLHNDIRWLSRGRILARVFELQEELRIFFKNKSSASEKQKIRVKRERFSDCLNNELWGAKLAYIQHIFEHLNNLNTSLQGRNENVLTSTDKLIAFDKKLSFWMKKVDDNNLAMFPKIPENMRNSLAPLVKNHLDSLQKAMKSYFPSMKSDDYDWIRNPFINEIFNWNLCLEEEEELISISSDRTLKIKYGEVPLDKFWITVRKEYPKLSKIAINILLQFSTSYLCELGFSTLTNMKSKKRSRLANVEDELRVALSEVRPDIREIAKKHQSHISH